MQELDPWGQVNIKDYKKLCEDFGIDEFSKVLPKDAPFYMRRGAIFGHKGFEQINKAISEKKKFVLMTGLMPSGTFHFGHKMIIDQAIYYQKLGAECYIAVADIEAYLTRNISLEQARNIAINEYLVNYIALGLKPKNLHFYFQSEGKKDYMNFSKFVSKKTTFNEVQAIYGDTSPAKLVSALTQVADILHPQLKEFGGPKPTIVPVGADQLPHINFTRDIASRMSEYKFIPPSATFNILIPGLQGGKMSSSMPESYIAFNETPEEVKRKIMRYAFSGGKDTLEEHRKLGGNPDVDISFQWLKLIFEESDAKLKKIEDDYRSGKLLSGELKQILVDKINSFLKLHNHKRKLAEKQVKKYLK